MSIHELEPATVSGLAKPNATLIAIIAILLPNQGGASGKPKLGGNPYGSGEPVPQDRLAPIYAQIKALRDSKVRKQAAAFEKHARARYEYRQKLINASKQLGLILDGIKKEVWHPAGKSDRSHRPFPHDQIKPRDRLEHGPSAGWVKPMSWSGSGGAIRSGPYDYWYAYDSISEENGPDWAANGEIDPMAVTDLTGYLEWGAGGSSAASSTILSQRSLGIYVRPPNAGLLTFSGSAVLQGWGASYSQGFGGSSSVLNCLAPEVWRIQNVDNFSEGESMMLGLSPGWVVDFSNQGNLFNGHHCDVSGINGGLKLGSSPFGPFTTDFGGPFLILSPTPKPQPAQINVTFPVDTDHYYILWITGFAWISSDGLDTLGEWSGTIAGAAAGASVLEMSWTLQP